MPDHKLTVGQKLWYVPDQMYSNRRPPDWVTIDKVGRKWVTVEPSLARFNVKTLSGDGHNAGRCYLTKEEHDAYVGLRKASGEFRQHISNRWAPPSGITLAQVTEAKRALGITPTQEQPHAE